MIEQILLAIIIGIALGTITGIIPGIHINLLIALFIGLLSSLFAKINPTLVIAFVMAISTTHIFVGFIPSIYLGVPTSDTILNVLPGHKMVKKGLGHKALYLNVSGALISVIFLIILIPAILFLIPKIYGNITDYIGYILILISILLILSNKKNYFWSAAIFILSGVLGITVLNNTNIKEPLLPLFSGLFGVSTLAISLLQQSKIPPQLYKKTKINKKRLLKYSLIGSLSSSLFSFLPTLSPSQIIVVASSFLKKIKTKQYLILIGAINIASFFISILALYLISKARNVPIFFIQDTLNAQINLKTVMLLVIILTITSAIAALITLRLSRYFAYFISKVNYKKLTISVILFILILVSLLSGILGIVVLITSSALGIACQQKNINKNILMASLIIPTILYYLA